MKFIFGYLLVMFLIINQIDYGESEDGNDAAPTTKSTAKPGDDQATTAKDDETTKKNDENAADQKTTAKPSTDSFFKKLRDALSLLWHKFLGRPDKQEKGDEKGNQDGGNDQKDEKGKEQKKEEEQGKGEEGKKEENGKKNEDSGSTWRPKSLLLSLLFGIPRNE